MLPLNFNHLYYFYVVARHGSFSQAAEELRVSQSAISVQIKQLETSLGHTLFNRIKSGVELTEPGMVVFQYADGIFHDVDRVRDTLAAIEHDVKGHISIGTVNSIGIYVLPEVLRAFKVDYPSVKMNIDFKPPRDLVEMVRRGKLDFAILTSHRRYPGLADIPLQKMKMFLVAPKGHPLADQESVSPSELEKYPFLGFEEGTETRGMIDALFRRMALGVEYAVESSNTATIKHMALSGIGLAILPEAAIGAEIRSGALVRLDVPSLYVFQDVVLYYKINRTLTPTKREFVKLLQHETKGERPIKP